MKAIKMLLRPSARMLSAAAALVLAGPVLTSCGFDYATDRNYTPAAGANDRDASVDILGAVVVSAEADSGTFIATFVNNKQDIPATVVSIAGAGDDVAVEFDDFDPIEIAPNGMVNLATDEQGIVVTGDFDAGYSVDLTISVDNGETIEMTVPTVSSCNEYAGLDRSEGLDPAAVAEECEPAVPEHDEH